MFGPRPYGLRDVFYIESLYSELKVLHNVLFYHKGVHI